MSPDTCPWSSKLHDMLRLEAFAVPVCSIWYRPAVILGKLLMWFLAGPVLYPFLYGMKVTGLVIALQNWEAPNRIKTALK